MSKITLTQLSNVQTDSTGVTEINANSTALQTAFDNTLSRDGTTPNQMGADLDMNSNRILNLPAPASSDEPARLGDIEDLTAFDAVITAGISSVNAAVTSGIAAIEAVLNSPPVNIQTGTSYTLQVSDGLGIVSISNATSITVTLPNSLSSGFTCIVEQEGAGQITFTPAAGATLTSPGGATKTYTQYAQASVFVRSNSGSNAAWRLGGDITT